MSEDYWIKRDPQHYATLEKCYVKSRFIEVKRWNAKGMVNVDRIAVIWDKCGPKDDAGNPTGDVHIEFGDYGIAVEDSFEDLAAKLDRIR